MIGAIAGDIIGSVYEGVPIKTTDFPLFSPACRFTDDTVLTVALADSILTGVEYVDKLHEYFERYPQAGYGGNFIRWAKARAREPYHSFGNGSAMRVSPVAFAYDTLDEVLEHAKRSAEVTHNHPEGIKGAQATAAAVFLARQGESKERIKDYLQRSFAYDLSLPLSGMRLWYYFDVTCQGSVPPAISAFLESTDYEHAVRLAISLGGDADTMACIAGGIAQAFYRGVPAHIQTPALAHLDDQLLSVVQEFTTRFACG